MKTIEERADDFLAYERDFLGRDLSDYMVCRAYVKGATDQKTRTLNKVYNIITEELGESCGTALIKVIQNAFGE